MLTEFCASMIEVFSRVTKFYHFYRCLGKFQDAFIKSNKDGSDEDQIKLLKTWIRERLLDALRSQQVAHPQDAACLIKIVKEHGDEVVNEM